MSVRAGGDTGTATVWVLVAVTVVAAVAGWCVTSTAVATLRTRAGVAADLAALAGAGRLVDGSADPCGEAARVAEANGARLRSCVASADRTVQVEVELRGRGPLAEAGPARARARAGPAP